MSGRVASHCGLLVQLRPTLTGDVFYAEVEPAGSRWLPWPGRTSRWWYEVHAVTEPDAHGIEVSTYAYLPGGSGGGFTLAACVRRAEVAVEHFADERDALTTSDCTQSLPESASDRLPVVGSDKG